MCRTKNFVLKKTFFFSLLFVLCSLLFAYSGPDEPLTVITKTEPITPLVGQEWKISLLVDYPEVNGVFVQMPQFPNGEVQLDSVRTEPHRTETGETWTIVEFFFIPLKPGNIILQPFEIKTPDKSAFTSQMVFNIEDPQGSYVYQPLLRWETVPTRILKNQSAELLLLIQNKDPQKPIDDTLPFNIDIPKDAILERIPLTSHDRQRNGILRLRIIPLQEGMLSLNPITIEYDGVLLASPSLQLQVVPASANAQTNSAYTLSNEELNFKLQDEEFTNREENAASSFYPKYFFGPFKNQYDKIIDRTETLWNSGKKAEALAEIRKAERDSTIGYSLRPFRKELEQELELGITEDEMYLPVHLFIILSAVFFILSIIFFIYRSFFSIVSYTLLVIMIMAALFFGAFAAFGMIKNRGENTAHQVVMYGTEAYRVPEITGTISGSFQEGESGVIVSAAGDWLYIETNSGKAGWVQAKCVIRY